MCVCVCAVNIEMDFLCTDREIEGEKSDGSCFYYILDRVIYRSRYGCVPVPIAKSGELSTIFQHQCEECREKHSGTAESIGMMTMMMMPKCFALILASLKLKHQPPSLSGINNNNIHIAAQKTKCLLLMKALRHREPANYNTKTSIYPYTIHI